MLEQLFFRSDALTRHLSAPLVHERGQYLAHCAAQGISRSTLRAKRLRARIEAPIRIRSHTGHGEPARYPSARQPLRR